MTHPHLLRAITRRHFFRQSGFGIGGLALTALLDEKLFAQKRDGPLAPRAPHFAAKAKNPIYLFTAGRAAPAHPLRPQPARDEHGAPESPAGIRPQGGSLGP